MWTIAHYSRNLIGHSRSFVYFCTELKRNIDYGKTVTLIQFPPLADSRTAHARRRSDASPQNLLPKQN